MLECLVLFIQLKRRIFIMAKCDICGKGPQFGNKISHSHKITKRKWLPNIQKVKVSINNTVKTLNVCTKCLKAGKVKKVV